MSRERRTGGRPARGAGSLWDEVRDMLSLRRQLAEIEIRSDLATAKRAGILAGLGAVLLVAGFVLMLVLLAGLADGWIDRTRVPWATLSLALLTLATGGILVLAAVRGVRRDLRYLRDSRAELAEDMVWLEEWAGEQFAEPQHDRV